MFTDLVNAFQSFLMNNIIILSVFAVIIATGAFMALMYGLEIAWLHVKAHIESSLTGHTSQFWLRHYEYQHRIRE